MGTATIILLNGTPSSGKTTLARALHAAWPEPAFFLGLDDFRMSVPARFWTPGDTPQLFSSMLDAWLLCLREVALHGIVVIAEASITPGNRQRYVELFGDLDSLVIGVRCPLETVRLREASRGDRLNGPYDVTAEEIAAVHRHDYAIEVDTSIESTARSVDRILETWHEGTSGTLTY